MSGQYTFDNGVERELTVEEWDAIVAQREIDVAAQDVIDAQQALLDEVRVDMAVKGINDFILDNPEHAPAAAGLIARVQAGEVGL